MYETIHKWNDEGKQEKPHSAPIRIGEFKPCWVFTNKYVNTLYESMKFEKLYIQKAKS